MIEELKLMLDAAEGSPFAKDILLKVASLKEENQKPALELIKLILENDGRTAKGE